MGGCYSASATVVLTNSVVSALAHLAKAGDRAAFDAEAARSGSGWLSALCASVEAPFAAQLREEARRLVSSWAGDDAHYHAFVGSDPAAAWFLVEAALAAAHGPVRAAHTYNPTAYALMACWELGVERPETPWLWLEASLPLASEAVRSWQLHIGKSHLGARARAAVEHLLSQPEHRSAELARLLLGLQGVSAQLALEWLLEPRLRKVAAEVLRPDVRRHEAELRALLERAVGSQRKAIAELLREVDPGIALSVPSADSAEEKLLERLRIDPLDDDAHSVWSDMLMARGDPRGEMIVLERALRAAPVAEQAALSHALAEHVAKHAKKLWDKPGGYPHRDRYRGRSRFECSLSIPARGSIEQWALRTVRLGSELFAAALPTAVLAHDEARKLGREKVRPVEALRAAAADPAAFAKQCAGLESFQISYVGKICDPSGALLPYQDAGHYVPAFSMKSTITLIEPGIPSQRRLELELWLPFEDRDDPGFVSVLERMRSIVGKVFRPKHFKLFSSSADGKKAVVRPNA